ncbi:MAG: DUF72 domain-containing protein [Caldilineaceae bacterium SB0664_bin_27]|uniref:DUF72 domain-containing protein n=1 Tax=Caldilineaceae bacterium SB0664_bin_27 TaxID=2605260 RepID=A0A6B0YMR6_9CHLR|nr:DUF72 domain-containing protein [Caldilineaceae bacterium SB0664_bin_27]
MALHCGRSVCNFARNNKPMRAEKAGTLRVGTSSWSFPDWRGVFYRPQTPADQQLSFYAQQFNSVEANTSFYALPAPKTLLRWLESVPEGFTFSLKAPREITHEKRLVNVEQATAAYLEVLRSLGPAAAPGLIQFPATFTRASDGRRLAAYIDSLAISAPEIPLSVEVRAFDLMTTAFARFLLDRGIGFVVVERTGQPDTFANWQAAVESVGTRQTLHMRLIGNDRDPLPDDKIIRRPQDELLDKWAKRIADLLKDGRDVYCYVHNPFEGHAPETVRRLRARIGQYLPLPDWNPTNGRSEEEEDGGQMSLF